MNCHICHRPLQPSDRTEPVRGLPCHWGCAYDWWNDRLEAAEVTP